MIVIEDANASDWVDAQFDVGEYSVLDDLVRLGVGWDHDNLIVVFDIDYGYSVAWMLCDVVFNCIVQWVEDCDDGKVILVVLWVLVCLGDF